MALWRAYSSSTRPSRVMSPGPTATTLTGRDPADAFTSPLCYQVAGRGPRTRRGWGLVDADGATAPAVLTHPRGQTGAVGVETAHVFGARRIPVPAAARRRPRCSGRARGGRGGVVVAAGPARPPAVGRHEFCGTSEGG